MRGTFSRIWSSAVVTARTLPLFSNRATVIVSFLLAPHMQIALSVLFGASLNSPSILRTAYAGALAGVAATICTCVGMAITMAKMQGTLVEVTTYRQVDTAYWLGILLPAAVASLGTGLVTMTAIWCFEPSHGTAALLRAITLLPAALCAGIALALVTSGIGVLMSDSLMALNLVLLLLPVATGVVVPISMYPIGVRAVVKLLPLSSVVTAVSDDASAWAVLGAELLRCFILGLVWLLTLRIFARRIRQGALIDG